jgi:hypothetical protein
MSNKTVAVNCKTDQYDALVDRTTIFGNPFREWKYGRADCIKMYRGYFYRRCITDPDFYRAVLGLRGKRIGCHCKPLDCHADVIAEFLNDL